MFLALRELVFARGRMLLMGIVVALLAMLTVLLSGLSSGLVNDGVSGLKKLPVTAFAFNEGTKTDNAFFRSVVDEGQLEVWRDQDGVTDATLLGSNIVNGAVQDGTQIDLTLFGVESDSFLAPEPSSGEAIGRPDGIVVSETLQREGVEIGDVFTLDRSDVELTVIGFTEGQATFGHVDIGYMPLDTWRLLIAGQTEPGAPTQEQVDAVDVDVASVVALQTADLQSLEDAGIDVEAVDAEAETVTSTLVESFDASPGYTAETLTLQMIQIFLYVICAMVVGAFFTVWTIQRTHELSVLRALSAPAGFLVRDALVQATVLLVAATAVGVAAGVGVGALMPEGMPFDLEFTPILVASALTIALGLVGAVVAVLRIISIDPLEALGGQR